MASVELGVWEGEGREVSGMRDDFVGRWRGGGKRKREEREGSDASFGEGNASSRSSAGGFSVDFLQGRGDV